MTSTKISVHMTVRFRRTMLATATVGALAAATAAATTAPAAAAPAARAAVRAAVQAAPDATTGTGDAGSRLAPQGCTLNGTDASCDLYAMEGTTQLLGTSIPIWGFSTTGDPGTATAPGPLLVVPQGTSVTITLHNQLAHNVSLALPGQSAQSFDGSPGDDLTGVGNGETRQYTFTADRPGTFVYEAGHTPDGAREVAMGLAGALVVQPADGTAYGNAAGMPDTSYKDESVLVLSEIDPAFNAAPMSFDLRKFSPKYRLINGKAFPETDPIATDQNHDVLLRYVNVGSQAHAMSVLGANQVEVAQDAHPMQYTATVTADTVQPGETLDTIVHTPSSPESKLAVYEPALHLDNDGQSTGDPAQLAFGGMMTFLDTHAPAPSTDAVGPTSKHVHVSPNPSDGQTDVTVTADLSDATTGGSDVVQAEFVVDDPNDVGVGFGIPMNQTNVFGGIDAAGATGTLPAGSSADDCTTAVTLYCLSAGKHTVYVRAEDSTGNWGVIGSAILNLPKTGPQTTNGSATDTPANGTQDVAISATGDDSAAGGTITDAEYYLDSVGGTGTAMTLNRQATVVSEDATIPAATVLGLGEGVHHVLVRSKDSLGLWGPTLDIPLTVDTTGPDTSAGAVGPDPTNGLISDPGNDGSLVVSAEIIDGGANPSNLVDAEAFLDPDTTTPDPGTGLQLLADDGAMDSPDEHVYGLIPLSEIQALPDGVHHVYVRGEDAAGNWGPMFGIDLHVDKSAPALGALLAPATVRGLATFQATAPVKDASLIAAAEYSFGATAPVAGKGKAIPVSVVNGKIVATIPLAGVPGGTTRLNLRVKDLAGNWSRVTSRAITVVRPNHIFASNFESAGFRDWSAKTGPVTDTSAARIRSANEPTSAHGLRIGGRTPGYLTDNTPSAENTYHARFAFDRHTLTTGTDNPRAVTLFEGRTAKGQAFAVQLQVKGTQAHLRTVLDRSGKPALVGAWVNLARGAHTIRIDWTAANTGSLHLLIDGRTVQVQKGNTSTLRIESVRLGITSQPSNTAQGVGYIDTFASTRNSL